MREGGCPDSSTPRPASSRVAPHGSFPRSSARASRLRRLRLPLLFSRRCVRDSRCRQSDQRIIDFNP